MYIIIGADLVPTKDNIELFTTGDKKSLIDDELDNILGNASYRIFNLEVPLTDNETPITKQGPNLIAPTSSVEGYKALGTDLLTLANNHIMDQNDQGLRTTINVLDRTGIAHVGAGENLNVASTPFIFDFAGKKIGVYACAEHEFSIATENSSGANPFDPLWSLDHVMDLKNRCDYVIVLYHGGKEHYRYPSPRLQKVCRRLVDKGADIVVCQHSHCIGCEEKYKDGTIVYGQGNFLFDHSDNECWKTSLLIKIEEEFSISYLPLVKAGNGVRLADVKKGEKILKEFFARSKDINIPGLIEEKYGPFATSHLHYYLSTLSGKKSIVFRVANRVSKGALLKKYIKHKYKTKEIVRIINYMDCEAHRELMREALVDVFTHKE